MRENWVILCGLIRNKDVTLDKLTTLKRWLDTGRIAGVVCCWWRRESDLNPDIVKFVLESGFSLVQIEEPRLKTVGHSIHQALSWWYALQAVPKFAFVLKIRPDLGALGDGVLDVISDVDLTLDAPEGWPSIFVNRVLVGNAFAISPYYIHDISFFGRREDLLKLANFDLSSEYVCSSLAPEQFFFRSPFASRFPLIDSYLQAYSPLQFDKTEDSERKVEVLCASDYYLDVFTAYLHILNTYFRIGFIPDQKRTTAPFEAASLPDVLNGKVVHDDVKFHAGACALLFTGEAPVKALLTGMDGTQARLAAAAARTQDYSYISGFEANPLRPAEAVSALQTALSEVVFHQEHKLDRQKDPAMKHFKVMGHHDRVGLTTQNDETKALEAELSRMRRIIDQLRENNHT